MPKRELLDDDAGTPAEVADSLADIGRLNRYFGGVTTTMRLIERIAQASGQSEFSLLEAAAGTGETPQAILCRLQPRGIRLRLTLLDRRSTHLGNGANKVAGDALALPFRDKGFDLISCGLFVHHLAPAEVSVFVKEALRCCRIAVLINDLIRHPAHWAVAHAGRPFYRSRLTRYDAPVSVRQSYTTEEMRTMLEQSGAAAVDISRHFFFRVGAIAWRNR